MACKNIAFSSQKAEAVPSNLLTLDFLLYYNVFFEKVSNKKVSIIVGDDFINP
jgi:hypothetical protein